MRVILNCRSCGNNDEKTLEQLGGDVKDNSADIDTFCQKCGTIMRSHYDCTSYTAKSVEDFKDTYPDLAEKIKAVNKVAEPEETTAKLTPEADSDTKQ